MNGDSHSDYDYCLEVLRSGDEAQLSELAQLVEGFPEGVDSLLGRRWIINAIDCGSLFSVEWMLARNVELRFRDEEGYTVLHSALERGNADRHHMIKLLLEAGADVNRKGVNDWTPAHSAAVKNDVAALELLVAHGADLSIRTEIDNYATPLEEAEIMQVGFSCREAIAFLRDRLNKER